MIIERIPHFSDQQIINQFHNALDEIQKNGPRSAEAVLVIEAIQIEWQKRYAEISRGERKGALPKTGVLGVWVITSARKQPPLQKDARLSTL